MKGFFLSFIILIIVLAGLLGYVFVNTQPVSDQLSYTNYFVPVGANASQIGSDLYQKKLIKDQNLFKFYVKYSGISQKIQTGSYRLSPNFNLFQIVDVLSKNPLTINVTIPEGFTNKEIAGRFAKSLDQGQSFIDRFLVLAKDDQGYLFPDTYSFENNAAPEQIIAKMKANFDIKIFGLKPTRDQIVLASIIEKETKGVDERPVVAGILMNRLNAGMALQVDVAPETYKVVGLPPSPIANPGLISIKAAINPARTDYWYYLHDQTGQIHYAKTIEDHNANIAKYLQ